MALPQRFDAFRVAFLGTYTGGTFTAAWKKVVGLQKTHHGEFNLTGRAGFATNLRGIKHGRGVSNRIVIHEPKWLSGQVEEDYRKAVKITDYNRNFLKVKENMNGVSCFDALYDSHVKKKGNVFDLMVPINYTRKKGKQ